MDPLELELQVFVVCPVWVLGIGKRLLQELRLFFRQDLCISKLASDKELNLEISQCHSHISHQTILPETDPEIYQFASDT